MPSADRHNIAGTVAGLAFLFCAIIIAWVVAIDFINYIIARYMP